MKTTRMSAQRPRRILHLCALIVLVFPVLPLRGQSSTSLDLAGNVGQFTSQAIVNGNPAISYYDVTNGDLKYVRASDASGTSWGTPVTLDIAGNVGRYSSLAVVDGNPAISYYDETNQDLKYVRATDASGTNWSTPVTLDSTGIVGRYNSLAIVAGNPAVSYYDQNDVWDLKYVRANDASGTSWGTPVAASAGGFWGEWGSMAVINGNPAISFYDAGLQKLKFVRANDATGTSWAAAVSVNSNGTGGHDTSLAVVNGNPAISYWNNNNGDQNLTYVRANDANGTSWGTPVTLDSTGNVGQYTSLAIVAGYPAISYYDATNGDLKYVQASDASGISWGVPLTFDSTGDVGQYTSLAVINGNPVISYYDVTNGNLKWAAIPDIAVTQTNALIDGVSTVGFDLLAVGSSSVARNFTITNNGPGYLTLTAVTKDGMHPSDFTVNTTGMLSTLAAGNSTIFTVTFAPGSAASVVRTAAIHIASNMIGAKNPFDIAVTGEAYSSTTDTDSDGMNDWQEVLLASLGFNWQVNQAAMVNTYFSTASQNGLYTQAQLQALHVGAPMIARDPLTQEFKLTIGIKKSTDLIFFEPFPILAPGVTVNPQAEIEYKFTVPDNAAFFLLQTH